MKTVTAIAAVMAGAGVASAAIVPISNSSINDFSALELGFTPTPIDLSSFTPAVLGSANNNALVSEFNTGLYTGRLISEVFANVGSAGTGVQDVVIKYTMQVDAGSFDGLDFVAFGVNAGTNLDAQDLINATHGRVISESTVGQLDPAVSVDDASNVVFEFNFAAVSDKLGGNPAAGETFTWYVRSDGAVKVNVVDVTFQDGIPSNGNALAFVDIDGQADLNVPAPGSVALLGLGGMVAARRRRN
jgi:hypothetical protein